MTARVVAGVDWAGGQWLAALFNNRSYDGCVLEDTFAQLWEATPALDCMLVDVPIGLPDDEETVEDRETVDSLARSVTGRPSSVFPVPSRNAAKKAHDGADYATVASQNEDDIDKGLSRQSYHIAAGIGEVDAFLREHDRVSDDVIESHPEVCFRALLDRQLTHSKDSAAGVGERLEALDECLAAPGAVLQEVTSDLLRESDAVTLDDVLDAIVLGATAWSSDDRRYLPEPWVTDAEGVPMRMAYRSADPLPTPESI